MKLSKGFIFTVLTSLCWALLIFVSKIVLNQGEDEFNLIFWTTLLTIPYWSCVLGKSKSELKKLNRKGFVILLLVGLISTIGVKTLEILAIKNTTSINFSFLVRTVVIFTIIFEFIVFRKPITLKKIILALLILIGVYLLIAKGQIISVSAGDLLTIAEAMAIALGNNVLGKFATNLMSTDLSAAGSFFFGLIPLMIMCLLLGQIGIPNNWVLVLLAVLLQTLLTIFRYKGLRESSASSFTMIISVTPLWVTLLAISFLGEAITPIQIVGGVIIINSVFIVEKLKI